MNNKKWILRGCRVSAEEISAAARDLGISVQAARLLAVRGLIDREDIHDYFGSDLNILHAPGKLKDLDKGCAILWQAIQNGDKIAVFGDYDADGITSTTIISLVLKRLGAKFCYYIPRRDTEGYGLNSPAVEKLAAEGVKVLLTLDNGIAAYEQVQLAKDLGLAVIIADHHEVPFDISPDGSVYKVPPADAVIDPKQADCPYPFKSICAGMLAYKLAERLYELAGRDWPAEHTEYLVFAAIATVCDIMDLTDENRELVKYALKHIVESPNIGLRALLEVNSLDAASLTSEHIGFVLGPCINASGRLDNASRAVELFLTEDYESAIERARHLFELNVRRKDLSAGGAEKIRAKIDAEGYADDKVILVHLPELPESIAGIVAGRIKEIYNRPTFVLAGESELVRGSGRSVEGFNMFKALVECSDLLEMFGGHFMATGLTVKADNIATLRRRLNDNCEMSTDDMLPTVYIDLALPVERAVSGLGFAQFISAMAPFGHGNHAPLFGDRDLTIRRIQFLGKDEQVIRFFFADRFRQGLVSAISFHKKEEFRRMVMERGGEEMWQRLLQGQPVNASLDIVYTIEINEFRGNSAVQLQIKDLRLH